MNHYDIIVIQNPLSKVRQTTRVKKERHRKHVIVMLHASWRANIGKGHSSSTSKLRVICPKVDVVREVALVIPYSGREGLTKNLIIVWKYFMEGPSEKR